MWYKCALLKSLPTIPEGTTFEMNLVRNHEDQSVMRVSICPDTPYSEFPEQYNEERAVLEKVVERTLENNRIKEWIKMVPDEDSLKNVSCPECNGVKVNLIINEPVYQRTEASGRKRYAIDVIAECSACGRAFKLGMRSYAKY